MSFWDAVGGLGSAAAGFGLAQNLNEQGETVQQHLTDMGTALSGQTDFKGYSVATGLGTTQVGADGSTTLGVGQDADLAADSEAANAAAIRNLTGLSNTAGAVNPWANQALGQLNQSGMGLQQQQGGAFGASQQAMQNAMQSTAGREQEIYDRAMAMAQPGLDTQRGQQRAAEFASGRSGLMGSAFGGSGEDAAMARAQAGAQNQASFQAMGQAQQEMMNQGALATQFGNLGQGASQLQQSLGLGMNQAGVANATLANQGMQNQINASLGLADIGNQQFQNSFMPMQLQMDANAMAQNNANMNQAGDFTGAGYMAQLGLGGVQANINAQQAASQLYGNLFDSISDNAGAIGAGIDDGVNGLWDNFLSGIFT